MNISSVVKIAPNIDFLPSKLEMGFKKWEENGVIMLDQLFDGGVLMSYQQVQQKYNLLAHGYLQLRHYLLNHKEWDKISAPPSSLEPFFMLTITGSIKKRLRRSATFGTLQGERIVNSLDNKEKWELEMNTVIQDKNWELSCKDGHRILNSLTWRDFDRYFRTLWPSRRSDTSSGTIQNY